MKDKILVEYLRRSYQALDGLWFMLGEEKCGFEAALELDRRVWEVLAKIQSRKARELTHCTGNTPQELVQAFSIKLSADGQKYDAVITEAMVTFTLHGCNWLEILKKSGREHLGACVGRTICQAEGRIWGEEFGGEYKFEIPKLACEGNAQCEMKFVKKRQ
jgi:hypothetical protein